MNTMRLSTVAVVAALVVAHAAASTIEWVGVYGNNQWNTPQNWSPIGVPAAGDDVVIDNQGSVQLTTAVRIKSLHIGTASVTVFNALTVDTTATIAPLGNLTLKAGTEVVKGTFKIDGRLTLVDGALSGAWTVNRNGAVDMTSGGEKTFTAVKFLCRCPIAIGGLVVLNQSALVRLESAITASALMLRAEDSTAVLFDASNASSFTSSGVASFSAPTKMGPFSILVGYGYRPSIVSVFVDMTFPQPLHIADNANFQCYRQATVTLAGGVTGPGSILGACKNLLVTRSSSFSGQLALHYGQTVFSAPSTIAQATLNGGSLCATAATTVGNLTALVGGTVCGTSLAASTVDLRGSVIIAGKLTVTGRLATAATAVVVEFLQTGSLTIATGATADLSASSVAFNGPPTLPGFTNDGFTSVAHALNVQAPIKGTGTIVVHGKMTAVGSTIHQHHVQLKTINSSFSGQGTNLNIPSVSTTVGTVHEVIGAESVDCGTSCNAVDNSRMLFSFTVKG